MTWIATSGITAPEDVALCAGVGVDAVGVVVDSPTRVPWGLRIDEAEELFTTWPAGPQRLVVVGDDPDLALRVVRSLAPDVVHLHAPTLHLPGALDHTARTVRLLHEHDVRVMRTLRLAAADGRTIGPPSGAEDPVRAARALADTGVDLLMVDLVGAPARASSPAGAEVPPGLRAARAVRDGVDVPVVLAGGLRPETVGAALAAVGPYGVDVIRGVEQPLPSHRKSPERLAAFVAAVRAHDGGSLLIGEAPGA